MVALLGQDFVKADYSNEVTLSYTFHSGTNRRLQVFTDASADSVACENGGSLVYDGICNLFADPVKIWHLPSSSFPATLGPHNIVSTISSSQVRQMIVVFEFDNAQQDSTDPFTCSMTEYTNVFGQKVVYNNDTYVLDLLLSLTGNELTAQSSQTSLINELTNDGRRWTAGGIASSTTAPATVESNWSQASQVACYSVRIAIRDFSETKYTPKYNLVQQSTLADQSGTAATSITATTDVAATSGNLLILHVNVDKDSGGFNAISGWTLGGSYNYANGSSVAQYYRVADGTATDNSVTATWNTSEQNSAWIEEYDGFDNGVDFLDFSVGGSAASAVTSISTGSTGSISDVPALAISSRSADSNLVTNEYPFLTNQFVVSEFRESIQNYTVQGWSATKQVLSAGTVETTWSDPAGSSVRTCAVVCVFAESAGTSTPVVTGSGDNAPQSGVGEIVATPNATGSGSNAAETGVGSASAIPNASGSKSNASQSGAGEASAVPVAIGEGLNASQSGVGTASAVPIVTGEGSNASQSGTGVISATPVATGSGSNASQEGAGTAEYLGPGETIPTVTGGGDNAPQSGAGEIVAIPNSTGTGLNAVETGVGIASAIPNTLGSKSNAPQSGVGEASAVPVATGNGSNAPQDGAGTAEYQDPTLTMPVAAGAGDNAPQSGAGEAVAIPNATGSGSNAAETGAGIIHGIGAEYSIETLVFDNQLSTLTFNNEQQIIDFEVGILL